MSIRIINGDMLVELPKLAAEGFRAHSVITDPPYHLTSIVKRFATTPRNEKTVGKHAYGRHAQGFMGQTWDGGDIAFRPETWAAVHECMRPGAFLVAFASTRGYHRMVCAIEDAGFVIHPMLGWLFGSGFPKATRFNQPELDGWRYGLQALKPALEPICLAQKPLVGTGSANWAEHGCGGLNIDASRIHSEDAQGGSYTVKRLKPGATLNATGGNWRLEDGPEFHGEMKPGRWPANLLHDGSDEVLAAFPNAPGQLGPISSTAPSNKTSNVYGAMSRAGEASEDRRYSDRGSTSFAALPGERREAVESASRFFFCAKADADDRAGSKHPTVKPTALMRWLVQLITPLGGTILDPFAGTGSTGLAADQLGLNAVLIERDATYAADARRKIEADAPLFTKVA